MDAEVFHKKSRIPDCPHSLFEGTAGLACFLTDLTDKNHAAFPFIDVCLA